MSAQYVRHTFLLHPADRLFLDRMAKDDNRSRSSVTRVLIRAEARRRGWSDLDYIEHDARSGPDDPDE